MRKFIFIVLSVLLLFSLTTLAYAETDIKLSGRILVRGWYFDNVVLAAGDSIIGDIYEPVETPSHSLYSTNAYLTIDAKVADNVQGYMELETSESGTSGLYKWGTHDEKPLADLYFRQLWIQYTGSGLLGAPAGIKIGHQLLTLGEKQFLNHERFGDDAIVVFVQPTKELYLGAITAKLSEGTSWRDNNDDVDDYTILGTYKLDKDNTVGINYSYVGQSSEDLKFQNLGFHANGLISGVTYAAELDTQMGSKGATKVKFKGWGFMAKAGYKIDPVNLRASLAIGSGDNNSGDDNYKEFQVTMGGTGVSPLARYVHYTQIYERTVRTAAYEQHLGDTNERSTGIANTTYYNLGIDVMPVKDLSLSLDGFILRATKLWPTKAGSKNIGTELDLKGSYKIAKNLSYFVEAGFFNTGKFYSDSGIVALESNVKDVTQVIHGINLTF